MITWNIISEILKQKFSLIKILLESIKLMELYMLVTRGMV